MDFLDWVNAGIGLELGRVLLPFCILFGILGLLFCGYIFVSCWNWISKKIRGE